VLDYLPHVTLLAVLNMAILVIVIPWVLLTKKEPTSAVAWCLAVLLMPLVGALLFWMFGYNRVHRQVRKKRAHHASFHERHPPRQREADPQAKAEPAASEIARQALHANAYPVSFGNAVALHHDTSEAYAALLDAIRQAKNHVHLEFFSVHGDETGNRLLELLTEKARAGIGVRLLLDAVGSLYLRRRSLSPLREAGGKVAYFFPLNRLRSLVQINLRNHRKIVVVDGHVGFTGGMNIGDAYLGKVPAIGYWRDEFLRLEGPAVADLQRTFIEDWDFTTHEALTGPVYFPDYESAGEAIVQVAAGGPDQEISCIRELYFMGIVSARKRLWIASPYFVPDQGLLDALRLARYRGVDVRLLSILRPDHYLSFYAGRYYFTQLLEMGVKVYQYCRGMMHSKYMLVDGEWGLVGSANLDIRSLRLDFEAGILLHTAALVADMEAAFRRDLEASEQLETKTFAARSLASRLVENACRLLAPAL
jgi:cardiolipin synthase